MDVHGPGTLSLGRRFLEKIVQINFHIPRLDDRQLRHFVAAHLDKSRAAQSREVGVAEAGVSTDEVQKLAEQIARRAGEPEARQSLDQIRLARQEIQRETPNIDVKRFEEAGGPGIA